MDQVKYVFFSIGGYFGGYESIYLERGKDETRLSLHRWIEEPQTITKLTGFFDKVLADVEKLIKKWDVNYYNPDILDGTQWEILLSIHSKEETDRLAGETDKVEDIPGVRFSSGSNDYPKNFRELEKYMEELKDNEFKKCQDLS